MLTIYNRLIHLVEIHPIRFLGIIIGLAVLAVVFIPINHKFSNHKKQNIGTNKSKNTPKSKEDHRLFIGGAIVLLVIGAVAFSSLKFPKFNWSENLSVSSSAHVFGIDISHYQGHINWKELQTSHHPIKFIFIRSTMGTDGKDHRFLENWKNAKNYKYLRGAYHYYRPNENSTLQFNNFKSVVKLQAGDFVPILDVEKESKHGKENLRKGVLNWLKLAEEAYGVKPMIYTGLAFYKDILKGHVDDYPIWIAAYSGKHRLKGTSWTFHQFTERVRVNGIKTKVDGNDFNGTLEELKAFCIK